MSKLMIIEPTRHQVAITGQVTDEQTGRVIPGVRVEFTSSPSTFQDWLNERKKQYGDQWDSMDFREDRTRTSADGFFYFLDLPAGQYTLTASLPSAGSRYGTTQVVETVAIDASGNVTMVPANIALPPTTIKGKVTKQDATPVTMAEIRVKGSGERVFSNNKGEYLLTGLEKGSRTVLVSAQGYKIESQEAQVDLGAEKTLDFVLQPPTP